MRYLLHDVFTYTVQKFPSNIAISKENGEQISYQDLNKLSNKFADTFLNLKENDILSNPYIGVISSVNEKSIGGILGALKLVVHIFL